MKVSRRFLLAHLVGSDPLPAPASEVVMVGKVKGTHRARSAAAERRRYGVQGHRKGSPSPFARVTQDDRYALDWALSYSDFV